MEWFKFFGEAYLSDPKMMALSSKERSCWLTLLCIASVSDDSGRIRFITSERLMMMSGIDPTSDEWGEGQNILEKFVDLEMVSLESNGDVTILNWQKRQKSYLTGAERQKRYRERNKSDTEVTKPCNTSNARTEQNRTDTCEKEFSQEVVREVKEAEVERLPKLERRTKDKESVYSLFGGKQPWWFHKTQKDAAIRLFDRGLPKLQRGIQIMKENESDKFCPQAYTPFEYEKKLPNLNAYIKKNGL